MTQHRSFPDDVSKTARDAAYVAIGLGVLGFQRAQVRRRELMNQLGRASGDLQGRVGELSERFGELSKRFGELPSRVGDLSGRVGDLPGRLGEISGRLGDLQARLGAVPGRVGDLSSRVGDLAGASVALQRQLDRLGDAIGDLPADARSALVELDGVLDTMITKLETTVEPLEEKLPVPARDAVRQARTQVADARRHIHQRIRQLAS